MDRILEQIQEWLQGLLVDGIMDLLSGMFATVNDRVPNRRAEYYKEVKRGIWISYTHWYQVLLRRVKDKFIGYLLCTKQKEGTGLWPVPPRKVL